MLQRVLERENVDERTRELLGASGVRSYRQLVQRPLWDAAQAADVSVPDMATIITKVSARLAPKSRSVGVLIRAFDMFLETMNRPLTLRTGLPIVDAALGGGLRCGAINEFAGSPAIGKTQLAMTLAVRCALEYPDRQVLYIDTERGFSAKRLDQIARAQLSGRFASSERATVDEQVADVLRRVLVHRASTLAAFLNIIKAMDRDVPEQKVQLIVVDSIAAPLVKAHDLTFTQREHHLLRIARHLKFVGDVYKAFVIVTNRATTVHNDMTSFTKPLLGDTWGHCVTSRFVLERHPMYRAITIVKCPTSGHEIQLFDIAKVGVEPAHEPMLGQVAGDDDDFSINDDVLRELDLTGLPTVDPSRSTQQSEASASEEDAEDGEQQPSVAVIPSDDIVSDSNDESDQDDEGAKELALSWLKR